MRRGPSHHNYALSALYARVYNGRPLFEVLEMVFEAVYVSIDETVMHTELTLREEGYDD